MGDNSTKQNNYQKRYPMMLTPNLYFTGYDDGEHFTLVDTFSALDDAQASFDKLIADGNEGYIQEIELGVYTNPDTDDEEMVTLSYYSFAD
jgi:hypothetical protein